MPDRRTNAPARPVELPIDPVSHPRAVFDPVVAGEAIEREQIAVLEIDRPGVLVGNGEVADRRAGDDLHPWCQDLRAAEQRAHERPFHIDGADRDRTALPPWQTAIEGGGSRCILVRMIDIAAQERSESDFLAPWGDTAQVPLRACERPLRILPGRAGERERVDLQLKLAAEQRVVEAVAVVDLGQGDRHQTLLLIGQQHLRVPAGDREIRIVIDALDVDGRAQAVVAADVVAAQERPVAGEARRSRHAPVRVELEASVGVEIPAPVLLRGRNCRAERNARAVSKIAGDLVGADAGQSAILRGDHRRGLAVGIAGEQQVAIVGEPPVVAVGQLESIRGAVAKIGNREARIGLPADRQR